MLFARLIPIDVHHLHLEHVEPGRGFQRRSTSLVQRAWHHDRSIEPNGPGCRVTDEVSFRPRLPFLAPLYRVAVGQVFAHRHRRLRARFGAAGP